MKRILSLLAAILMFTGVSAFADLDCRNNGSTCPSNPITGLDFQVDAGSNFLTETGLRKKIAVADPTLFAAGVAQGDYTSMSSSATAVPVGYSFIRKVLDTNSNDPLEQGTLANGVPGQILTIYATGYAPAGSGTGATFTVTPTTSVGFSSFTMTKLNDVVTLMYLGPGTSGVNTSINSYGWVILSYGMGGTNSITINLKD